MTTEKMNVHQALAELKMLDKRIYKEINGTKWVVANKHSNTKLGGVPVSEFAESIKSDYQKVSDLIRRATAIKRAVVLSNATTTVQIGGETYTVAEAIEMKNTGIPRLRSLRDELATDLRNAQRDADVANGPDLEYRTNKHMESMYSNSDLKNMSEEMRKVREEFIKQQTVELVDPIKAKDEIEKLTERIDDFQVNVDAALSVSNALTEITVSY